MFDPAQTLGGDQGSGDESPVAKALQTEATRFVPESSHRPTSLLLAPLWHDTGPRKTQDYSFTTDLNLDQVIRTIAGDREEHNLIASTLLQHLDDVDTINYRQEVFRDLEDKNLLEGLRTVSVEFSRVRMHLKQLETMPDKYQRQGWCLDAAAIYCNATTSLAATLDSAQPSSRAFQNARRFLASYIASSDFAALQTDTGAQKATLAGIRYCVRIRDGRVDVSRYGEQPDYSAEILKTFEPFRQKTARDYLVKYPPWAGMNTVGSRILKLVARLFTEEFAGLDEYCNKHGKFVDETLVLFDRELQFYLAYIDYIAPVRAAGLSFCYPGVSTSREIFATETFDLALARKLVLDGTPVILNDFSLAGSERVILVSGPNQGGKTTFARTFGQLHHLATVGCPVPGTTAQLHLYDRLFTHFAREEELTSLRGKLEDDLVRIREVLLEATTDSIVIVNEIFTSTTLSDARFLGQKVLEKIVDLGLLCVYVTFVDELAAVSTSIVSMVSTIVPEDPSTRTYKLVRQPADGLAYALAIAEKYHVNYDNLKRRLLK